MSIRARLARWIAPAETRAGTGWTYGGPLPSFVMGGAASGMTVQPWQAENLATVQACVSIISASLAALPAYVFNSTGEDGREEAPGHPVSRLIRAPNRYQSWAAWLETTVSSALLWGNGLSVIEHDGAGRATALVPVEWRRVSSVQLLPSGRLAYDITGRNGEPVRRYLDDEVFHLRDRSDDGIIGRSRLSRGASVITAALGLQDYSGAIWDNAATPSVAVTLPAAVTPDGKRRIESHFEAHSAGARNGKRVLFVENGQTVTPMSVSPEDAEVLMSRRYTGEELARLYNVPPPLIGDLSHGSFTNSETAGRFFAQFCLSGWARRIELEFQRSIFVDPSYGLEIDMSQLLRGSPSEQWANAVAAVAAGIITVDEAREQFNYGPKPATASPAAPPAPGVADPADPGDPGTAAA